MFRSHSPPRCYKPAVLASIERNELNSIGTSLQITRTSTWSSGHELGHRIFVPMRVSRRFCHSMWCNILNQWQNIQGKLLSNQSRQESVFPLFLMGLGLGPISNNHMHFIYSVHFTTFLFYISQVDYCTFLSFFP